MAFEINPWNVVKLLYDFYSARPHRYTPINSHENNLMNKFHGIDIFVVFVFGRSYSKFSQFKTSTANGMQKYVRVFCRIGKFS